MPSPVERELFAAEDEWTRALVHRDAAIFDRLIAPDWVYSDERGIIGKRQAIAAERWAGAVRQACRRILGS